MLKIAVIIILAVATTAEFFKVERKSAPKITFRKGDLSGHIAGTLFGIIAVLIFLFA